MIEQKLNITVCKKVCGSCGFDKKGTKNTLYAESKDIIDNGIVFPCHLYLKAHTGSENQGTETLDEIHVCRGYVAYMKLFHNHIALMSPIWYQLFESITEEDMKDIYSPKELIANHKALREGVYLGN